MKSLKKTSENLIPKNSDLDFLEIPEPTKSLIFIENESLSKIKDPMHLGIMVTANGIETEDTTDIFSEPSLIWTKLPIEENSDLEIEKMYYPSYARLNSIQRFQYLNWLKDINQQTNLSYVFLYYYGLERHLLIGNYDLAVDEIIRLIKNHDKGTFKSYATTALLASSIYRKRLDILNRAPFVMDELTNIGLFIKWQIGDDINTEELMKLSHKVGFKNNNYLKNKPDIFKTAVEEEIANYTKNDQKIIDCIDFNKIEQTEEIYFANISIPEKIRTIKNPQIMKNDNFKKVIFDILNKLTTK